MVNLQLCFVKGWKTSNLSSSLSVSIQYCLFDINSSFDAQSMAFISREWISTWRNQCPINFNSLRLIFPRWTFIKETYIVLLQPKSNNCRTSHVKISGKAFKAFHNKGSLIIRQTVLINVNRWWWAIFIPSEISRMKPIWIGKRICNYPVNWW